MALPAFLATPRGSPGLHGSPNAPSPPQCSQPPAALPASRVHAPHGLGTADGGAQPGLHVVIVALVLVLLLAPGQLGIGVLLHLPQQKVKGEWRQLWREPGLWSGGACGEPGRRHQKRRGVGGPRCALPSLTCSMRVMATCSSMPRAFRSRVRS